MGFVKTTQRLVLLITLLITLSTQQQAKKYKSKPKLPGEYNEPCADNNPCRDHAYICDSNFTCQCLPSFMLNEDKTRCVGVVGKGCLYDADCTEDAFCKANSVCACKRGYIQSEDGTCIGAAMTIQATIMSLALPLCLLFHKLNT